MLGPRKPEWLGGDWLDGRGRWTVVQAAEDCLRRNPYLGNRGLSCDFRQGVLSLHGRLSTYFLKQLAQEAVRGLQGVEQVVNDIEVLGKRPR